jgi:hypothetical protein
MNTASSHFTPLLDEIHLISVEESDGAYAASWPINLVSPQYPYMLRAGYRLLRQAIEQTFFQWCLNYRGLVAGLSIPS